jgi:hypothetical protein
MTDKEFMDYFGATAIFSAEFGSVPTGKEQWRERLTAIKKRYALYQRMVDDGVCSWERGDPYSIADWLMIFTPIERGAWSDIRELPFSVWPQYPVGKYFVDFAIVHKRIAIECDGAAYHNAEKDAKRDVELASMGWRVVRIPGKDCWTDECGQIIKGLA